MFNDMLTEFIERQRAQQLRESSRQIPGLTGPVGSGAGIPGFGMAPPQQPTIGNHMMPPQALQPFMATGPYSQQAQQLAGLLGSGQPAGGAQINAMLGDKTRRPFYRPTGK